MSLGTVLGIAALVGTCTHAWIRGGSVERMTATALAVATIGSVVVSGSLPGSEFAFLAIDVAVLAFLFGVALACDRFWPLYAVAFQLDMIVMHVAVARFPDMMPGTYAHLGILWDYLVMVALTLGVHFEITRAHQSRTFYPGVISQAGPASNFRG